MGQDRRGCGMTKRLPERIADVLDLIGAVLEFLFDR